MSDQDQLYDWRELAERALSVVVYEHGDDIPYEIGGMHAALLEEQLDPASDHERNVLGFLLAVLFEGDLNAAHAAQEAVLAASTEQQVA